MKLCYFNDTAYNLDKFIGVEVVDNSDDLNDCASILFRFEGDYKQSNDEDRTPYSFEVTISSFILKTNRIDIDELESTYENRAHDIIRAFASEFVEAFREKLEDMTLEDNYSIDLGRIRRDIIDRAKDLIETENKRK